MDHDSYDDTYIRGILNTVKTIAMVGVSANTSRPSYFAFKYLLERGYRMIPVNPSLAEQGCWGARSTVGSPISRSPSTWSTSSDPRVTQSRSLRRRSCFRLARR